MQCNAMQNTDAIHIVTPGKSLTMPSTNITSFRTKSAKQADLYFVRKCSTSFDIDHNSCTAKVLREGSQSPNPSGHSKMVSREQHLARLVQQHSGPISVTWYMYQLNIITAIWKLPRPCPLQLVLHLTAYNTLTCQTESSVPYPELSLQLVQPQSMHTQHYPPQLVLHLPAAHTRTYQTKPHSLYINTHYWPLRQVLHLTAHNTMTHHTQHCCFTVCFA